MRAVFVVGYTLNTVLHRDSMPSTLLSLTSFLLPFLFYGNYVGCFVSRHLAKSGYSASDVQMGHFYFYVFAGLSAGASCLALTRILMQKKKRFVSFLVVFFPLVLGYYIADVTLYGFYERPIFSGTVLEWLIWTATAFALIGVLPATILFALVNGQNKHIALQS